MYNLYIDESCHLENDKKPVMCIGYTKVLTENYLTIKEDIKQLKLTYKTPTEIKWNTVSYSRMPFYKALIDYFFEKDIDFRCVLIKYKAKLEHQKFNNGSHDTFYYKIVFFLLKSATNPLNEYKVYLDIKDTRGNGYYWSAITLLFMRDCIMNLAKPKQNLLSYTFSISIHTKMFYYN